ncbi:MAG: hypothetical protein ACJASQ_001983 [Crocinitomicaceae bacterium]|jgi:hypothetical protein
MSTFSKKYYSQKDSSFYLSLAWEKGYKNIQIFHGERLVHTIPGPAPLMKGVQINDSELGKVKIKFTIERPHKLEIKVNGKKFKTVNNIKLGYDYTGLITVFSVLALFATLSDLIFLGSSSFNFQHSVVFTVFVIDIIVITSYILTAYFLVKRKPHVYFLGTIIFTLTSAFDIFGQLFEWNGVYYFIFLFFRIAFLIFIYSQIGNIIKAIDNSKSNGNSKNDLLDND